MTFVKKFTRTKEGEQVEGRKQVGERKKTYDSSLF